MANLNDYMPPIAISESELREWGSRWLCTTNQLNGKQKEVSCFDRQQSVNFASFIDEAFGRSLAYMLGEIPVVVPHGNSLIPSEPDCVEVGAVRIIGGIRPQNFDAAYRPDGPRVVFDSKTLNDKSSIQKNWQNMVNDLATEAATVHTRFPYAIVSFAVVLPEPAVADKQYFDLVRTLERLGGRKDVLDQDHLAEAVALILWNPEDGSLSKTKPEPNSSIRLESFSEKIFKHYVERYKGLPPHD